MKELVRESEDSEKYVSWSFQGLHTCRRAWKSLHNMGA